MIRFDINLKQWKNLFFDWPRVQKLATDATERELSRFGAAVMKRARWSIRKAPGKKLKEMTDKERLVYRRTAAINKRRGLPAPKKPTVQHGSPPGKPPYSRTGLLKQFILFGYDRSKRSVLIGAAYLHHTDGVIVPEVLEYGGRSMGYKDGKRQSVFIQARPFMRPAFETVKPQLPGMWANSIKP